MNDIDKKIQDYLDLAKPTSFFLFAGAGSGKTSSLVNALIYIKDKIGGHLQYQGKKVAVITYTNAASDEIIKRLEFNSLFETSTIHSFVWTLIKPFSADIKTWLDKNLQEEIAILKAELAKGRSGTKTEIARIAKLSSKEKRLQNLENISQFNYSPTGENTSYDSLNHSEVINIASDFLVTKPLMQHILVSKYPILFIDECQDTNKDLIEAVLAVEANHKSKFLLGLFGDTMQRIYLDGKIDLSQTIPAHWAQPSKLVNYRSPRRVIDLINKIRKSVDGLQQSPQEGKENGFVRLFLSSDTVKNKDEIETTVQQKMKAITQDESWSNNERSVKKLILEHHMAARRLGFSSMFDALYTVEKFRTGLLNGTLRIVKVFSDLVLPLLIAKSKGDEFTVANIVHRNSPLIESRTLKSNMENQLTQLKSANSAVTSLYEAWNDKNPSFQEILKIIGRTQLFEIPALLQPFIPQHEGDTAKQPVQEVATSIETEEAENEDLEQYTALEIFLKSPFNQVRNYWDYIHGKTAFDTHQGIKGREFPRVMVIIDDSEAKGFLYKYDKLFGVEPPSKTDHENEKTGKDSALSRPKRLFYVTCSRAESSLAIVAYTKDRDAFKTFVVKEGWFEPSEIELL